MPNVWALDIHDLTVSKLMAGRDKDFEFLRVLLERGWIDFPTLLERLQSLRDTAKSVPVPAFKPEEKDGVVAGAELLVSTQVVLEEYSLTILPEQPGKSAADVAGKLEQFCADPLWRSKLKTRLAIVPDENFQHFVTTCTEVVTRVEIDPLKRTVKDGHLFNQENIPCFYVRAGSAEPERLLHQTETWLRESLTQAGLGAKTAAGYGRFRDPTPADREREKIQRQEAEAASQKADEKIKRQAARAAQQAKAQAAMQSDFTNDANFKNRVLDKLNPGACNQLEAEISILKKSENVVRLDQLKKLVASKDYKDVRRRLREKSWFPKEWLPPQP